MRGGGALYYIDNLPLELIARAELHGVILRGVMSCGLIPCTGTAPGTAAGLVTDGARRHDSLSPLYIGTYSTEYSETGTPGKTSKMPARAFVIAIRSLLVIAMFVVAAAGSGGAHAQGRDLLVFAAASLNNALDDADAQYLHDAGHKVVVSYGASSTLAKQIENGAPADIFISADLDWMDYAAAHKLIKPETRSNLLGNKLVLIAPADSHINLTIAPNFPLAQALGNNRLAMADPAAVPAGKYGKAALEALGVWPSVASKIAPAQDVRATLLLVSRGEAPLGIVYQTDAAADKSVKIIGAFPESTHPPIVYPIAVTTASTNAGAAAYIGFLKSPAARPAFEKQGFVTLQ
jgi:molybdate transport system substrate-binding protein